MTEPIDELLEWLHTFDELQFSCNHRNVIEKIWQIKSKQQFAIHSVVVPKGTLSNLDEAIKKAKPNMDKIKDVDKHLDSIR